jgi:ribosome-binding protein aMBF1 (putative translation factor)
MVPDKYGISALLDVQIQSLVRRFSRLASHEQYLSLRIDVDLPGILREARQALKLNQGSAASKVGVPLATYKSWEARKHQPEPDNRDKVEGFIREALSRYAPTLS